MEYLSAQKLCVGYNKRILIGDIDLKIGAGEIITLIGRNGSGKSTILKSLSRQLDTLGGVIYVNGSDVKSLSHKDFATKFSVVLTERIKTDRMTCREIVEAGRYPYTNFFGKLKEEDKRIVEESIRMVGGESLSERLFSDISDGQRQRILLARAICQQPQIMILDEPTSFLDIRYKIELLGILRKLCKERKMSVILSLHEIDLAAKISDKIVCVDGDKISKTGTPEEIFSGDEIKKLYGLESGSYNLLFGSVELEKPLGESKFFVLAGGGAGIPVYRALQRKGIAFSTGILSENDVDFQVAKPLAESVISVPAFSVVHDQDFQRAKEAVLKAQKIYVATHSFGECNKKCAEIIRFAQEASIAVIQDISEI